MSSLVRHHSLAPKQSIFDPATGTSQRGAAPFLPTTRAEMDALGWEGQGCSISQASASVLAEQAPGLTVAEARQRIEAMRELLRSRGGVEPDEALLGDAVAFAGVARFPMRVKCAMLAWVALEEALDQAAR